MSEYDGLNLPQLLDLMHGLVMPDAVTGLPITSGWWIVLAWLLAVLTIVVWYGLLRRRRNRYRRAALAALKSIDSEPELGPFEMAQRIALLLKRTALAAYPRSQVASLSGSEWAEFLIASTNEDRQIAQAAERLAGAAYRPDADGRLLSAPARRWIRKHRA
ncbi:MAG: DUF4381 family protein [Gammaproteobacteria bacterium]|nr:DUF4381 family protein [Gammaproteobacteria bacterium]